MTIHRLKSILIAAVVLSTGTLNAADTPFVGLFKNIQFSEPQMAALTGHGLRFWVPPAEGTNPEEWIFWRKDGDTTALMNIYGSLWKLESKIPAIKDWPKPGTYVKEEYEKDDVHVEVTFTTLPSEPAENGGVKKFFFKGTLLARKGKQKQYWNVYGLLE